MIVNCQSIEKIESDI